MEAGRELDAEVAAKVMGIDVQYDREERGKFWQHTPDDPFDYFIGATHEPVPAYSTDIAAAESVCLALRKRGFVVQVEWHPRANGFARVALKGEPMVDRPTETWDATGDSVAHAICLAALVAVRLDPRK